MTMNGASYNFNFVIYHANCVDGFGAAYAAWKHLGPAAEYVACQHGDEPPDVTGKRVLILDFSFKREIIELMNSSAEYLMILDHHKSAMENLCDLSYAYFDMEHSGAALAWVLFNPGCDPPKFISYIEDRDLWKWELPLSREVAMGLDTVPFDFNEYARLEFDPMIGELAKAGEILLRYNEKKITSVCQSASKRKITGYCAEGREIKLSASVVNSRQWHSEIGSRLASKDDVGVVWYHDHKKCRIKVSLRSRGNAVDVSQIAGSFGGGGHFNAAGFTIDATANGTIEDIFID